MFFHGGTPGLRPGAQLRAGVRPGVSITSSRGIARFYAATWPRGSVYSVRSSGRIRHDPEFHRSVPCWLASDAVILRELERDVRL